MLNFLKKKVSLWLVITLCILSVFLGLAGSWYGILRFTGAPDGAIKFMRTLNLIHRSYTGEYDNEKLFDGAISGMVKTLDDPYSSYMDKDTFAKLTDITEGTFGGIGVVVGKKDDNFVVIAPMEGTPGANAGIKAGEKILKIDGKTLEGLQLEEVAARIRGPEGTTVELTLENDEGQERSVKVVRGAIKSKSVMGKMVPDTKIGYIRIAIFNESTAADFVQAYHDLESQGMKATILDLRYNPGGLLTAAVRIGGILVPKGPIVSLTDTDGKTVTEYSKLEQVKYPLAVLVDHGTASASEIVAGALQDTKAGYLIGTQTYGKGVAQTIYQMDEKSGLKLTTANYYTPSGRSINKVGITPDEVVKLPKDATEDLQLQAAERYLQEQLAK